MEFARLNPMVVTNVRVPVLILDATATYRKTLAIQILVKTMEFAKIWPLLLNVFVKMAISASYVHRNNQVWFHRNHEVVLYNFMTIFSLFLACGGLLKNDHGVVKYPSDTFKTYKQSANCAWTILTNDTTKVLNITFIKFDLEHSESCQYDFLEVKLTVLKYFMY